VLLDIELRFSTAVPVTHCRSCDVECRIDFERESGDFPRSAPFIIRHCPDGQEISIVGKVTKFQERRGGIWVSVRRWIDAAQ
jgi:hypothetical protein